MKILSLGRNHYVARVSIFLLALVLIAGMASCGQVTPPATEYDLTMAIAPGGGGTATDLTDASPYTAGTAVSLKAEAAAGYQFVSWTATAGTLADANAAETTFTMPAQNVTATANFFQGQVIRTWSDLDAIRSNLSGNWLLMNNLDSTTAGYTDLASPTANGGKGWQPIGKYASGSFAGTFDGQGYETKDLFINRPDEEDVGLFGSIAVEGAIKDIGVVNANVTGKSAVGGLVGGVNTGGTVSNSYSTGSVTGNRWVGGLVGLNDGTVSHSYSAGGVTGNTCVGGLVGGTRQGTLSSSYATGDVTGNVSVGGLVGCVNTGSTVSNSYATGSVTGMGVIAGLVGTSAGTVSNSYSAGSVTALGSVGGLVGLDMGGTVSNSFWDTQTSGQGTSGGGTGKTTTEMKTIDTFQLAQWSITYVAGPDKRNPGAYWNIVPDQTYPFLSWQPVS